MELIYRQTKTPLLLYLGETPRLIDLSDFDRFHILVHLTSYTIFHRTGLDSVILEYFENRAFTIRVVRRPDLAFRDYGWELSNSDGSCTGRARISLDARRRMLRTDKKKSYLTRKPNEFSCHTEAY